MNFPVLKWTENGPNGPSGTTAPCLVEVVQCTGFVIVKVRLMEETIARVRARKETIVIHITAQVL